MIVRKEKRKKSMPENRLSTIGCVSGCCVRSEWSKTPPLVTLEQETQVHAVFPFLEVVRYETRTMRPKQISLIDACAGQRMIAISL
jgi:hypothetical protein